MDYSFELLKKYASVLTGRVTSPVVLNILITSVCDMRCVHCFFTEELDDKPRKKLQMTTGQITRISETLGGKLPVLIIAGGEPFTRKDLPEVASAFYKNNDLESIYLMSNGQIQKRIIPDVTRMLDECPNLNVTVALGQHQDGDADLDAGGQRRQVGGDGERLQRVREALVIRTRGLDDHVRRPDRVIPEGLGLLRGLGQDRAGPERPEVRQRDAEAHARPGVLVSAPGGS